MSRYIKIQTPPGDVWVNSQHIVSLNDSEQDWLIVRLVNGDQFVSHSQDAIDILSMLNLDTHESCGSQIADSPGVPVRTGMERRGGRAFGHWVEVEL